MGRKRTACQTCKSIKTLCSKGLPCERCKRLALLCEYGNEEDQTGTVRPRLPKGRAKQKHTKTSTGCLSCRRRRRKCDEKQPVCSDCKRLNLPCILPGKVEQQNSPPSSSDTAMPPLATDELLASNRFPEWAKKGYGDSESASLVPLSFFSDWLTLIETDNRIQTTRSGRLSNRTAIAKLGLPCSEDDELGLATFLPSTALNNLTGVTHAALSDWSIGERHLLNHFLQSVSRTLVVVEDKYNPFLRVIVPMALENTMVRHSMTALSACHLSKVYPEFEHDICVHRSKAMEGLLAELGSDDGTAWTLATTLLLCLVEICLGNSRKWLLHLHGARALLNKLDAYFADPTVNILIELYNYLSCISSVTSNKTPRRFGTHLQLPATVTPSGPDRIHPLFGISADLYESLAAISQLAALRCYMLNDHLQRKCGEVELALQSWTPSELEDQPRSFTEARALGFAFQWASNMRLQQVARGLKNNDPHIKKMSDTILSALSLIRPGSEMEASMLFPLFMAGVGSMTKPNRLTVEYRLNVMETTVGFGNILMAHRLLDEIWRKANQGEIVDWEELLRSKYQGLVLF